MSERISNSGSGEQSSWRGLYMAGGYCAIIYVLFALFVPFFMFINHTELSSMVTGADVNRYINENGHIWWVILQTLVLGTSFFAIVTFVAMFVALKDVAKSTALIGSSIAIVIHILFIAYYPVVLAMGFVAQAYQVADEVQRKSFETAAEPLLAMNNAFNPLYESVFAVSILILSMAMLKGVFNRKIAYLGFLTAISAFVALSLFPIISIGYFWWWIFFMAWFVLVGIRLIQLGSA
jgi:hypothetical protein